MMNRGLLNEDDPMSVRPSSVRCRSSMPRAYTIIELLVAIAILPFAMLAIHGLFRGFIHDVPVMTRLVHQNTTVQNLLEQIRLDMEDATSLPSQCEGRRADETLLLIEQPGGVVAYRFNKGQVTRAVLSEQASDERVWSARDAVIEWRPWSSDGAVCAVEIHSYLQQQVQGQLRRKFLSANLFFIRGSAQGGELQ